MTIFGSSRREVNQVKYEPRRRFSDDRRRGPARLNYDDYDWDWDWDWDSHSHDTHIQNKIQMKKIPLSKRRKQKTIVAEILLHCKKRIWP